MNTGPQKRGERTLDYLKGGPIYDGERDSLPLPDVRTIYARFDGPVTVRLLHDPHGDDGRRWFNETPPAKPGSRVKYLVNGDEAFGAMLGAIRSATTRGHFIYLANWYCDMDLKLAYGLEGTSLRELLAEAVKNHVQVRLLHWKNVTLPRNKRAGEWAGFVRVPARGRQLVPFPPSWVDLVDDDAKPWGMEECNWVNSLGGDAAAILDVQVPPIGSHHMKLLIVNGARGLIAFCGSEEFHEDRFGCVHDVHCQLEGQAAVDVLSIFRERWEHHPDRPPDDPPRMALLSPPPATPVGRQKVQVARTYANGKDHPFSDGKDPYGFAENGDKGVWKQLTRAIRQARKFIYLENQYFFSEELAVILAMKLPSLAHLTLLIEPLADTPGGLDRLLDAVETLKRADPTGQKLRVFALANNTFPYYVHSKLWIFDDELAIVGSANACNRSYTCDSEVAAAIHDASRVDQPAWRFAHRLRVRLWARHLGMNTREGHAQLADGVASGVHWLHPPPTARVWRLADYPLEDRPARARIKDLLVRDIMFRRLIDPFPGELL